MMRKAYEEPQIAVLAVDTERLCFTNVSDPEDGVGFGDEE